MSTHEPKDSDGDWVKRYRQASDPDAAAPSAATREAILAEGRRVAAARAANATPHLFDTKQRAANQPRWKLAAVGTVGAALFAAVLMFPHLGSPPSRPPLTEPASAPVASAPANEPIAADKASDALENIVVTGARRPPPPATQTLARKARPAPSRDAAELAGKAESTLQSSQDAASDASMETHNERMAPAVPAAPAASAAPAARSASAASPFLESHAVMGAVLSQSALSANVVSGDAARVRVLLDEGANPEQRDSLGRTPLQLAVIAHRSDLVELLLAHHANPNVSDSSGQTPLQRARLDAQLNIVELLERAGAH